MFSGSGGGKFPHFSSPAFSMALANSAGGATVGSSGPVNLGKDAAVKFDELVIPRNLYEKSFPSLEVFTVYVAISPGRGGLICVSQDCSQSC